MSITPLIPLTAGNNQGGQGLMLMGGAGAAGGGGTGLAQMFGGGNSNNNNRCCYLLLAILMGGLGSMGAYRFILHPAGAQLSPHAEVAEVAQGAPPSHQPGNPLACLLTMSCGKQWSQWGSWSMCTVTCGSGVRSRFRSCNTNYQYDCVGEFEQKQACNTQCCQIPGTWLTWSMWSTSVTPHLQIRSRTCYHPAVQVNKYCHNLDGQDAALCLGDKTQTRILYGPMNQPGAPIQTVPGLAVPGQVVLPGQTLPGHVVLPGQTVQQQPAVVQAQAVQHQIVQHQVVHHQSVLPQAAPGVAVQNHGVSVQVSPVQTAPLQHVPAPSVPHIQQHLLNHIMQHHTAPAQGVLHPAVQQVMPQHPSVQQQQPAVPSQGVQQQAVQQQAVQHQTVLKQTVIHHQPATQQNATQRTVPQHTAPQQAVPQHTAPQQAVPQQTAPRQAVPQQVAPIVHHETHQTTNDDGSVSHVSVSVAHAEIPAVPVTQNAPEHPINQSPGAVTQGTAPRVPAPGPAPGPVFHQPAQPAVAAGTYEAPSIDIDIN